MTPHTTSHWNRKWSWYKQCGGYTANVLMRVIISRDEALKEINKLEAQKLPDADQVCVCAVTECKKEIHTHRSSIYFIIYHIVRVDVTLCYYFKL